MSRYFPLRKLSIYRRIALTVAGYLIFFTLTTSDVTLMHGLLTLIVAYSFTGLQTASGINGQGNSHRAQGLNVFIAAILISFFLPISNFTRWVILAGIIFLIQATNHHQFKLKRMSHVFVRNLGVLLTLNIFYEVFKSKAEYSLQLLSFGYDNALHFAMFRQFNALEIFSFGVGSDGWNSSVGLFKSYPSGQGAIFSFLSFGVFPGQENVTNEIAAFLTLLLVSCLLILKSSSSLILTGIKRFSLGYFLILVALCVSIFMQSGIFITNGFPPYLLGTLIILIYLWQNSAYESNFARSFHLSVTIFAQILVCPAASAFLIVPAVRQLYLNLKSSEDKISNVIISLSPFPIFGILSLWSLQKTSAKFGWQQINIVGGLQAPQLLTSIITLLLSVTAVVKLVRVSHQNMLVMVFISGSISVGLLILSNLIYTGGIQYYAVKQYYVWLIISSILILSFAKNYFLNGEKLKSYISIVLIFFCSLSPAIFPRIFSGGFMGTPIQATKHLFQDSRWESEVVNAELQLKIAKKMTSYKDACRVYRVSGYESDLNSRWQNALSQTGGISDKCFEGFWNSSNLKDEELILKIGKLQGDFQIIVESDKSQSAAIALPGNVVLISVDRKAL